MANPNENPQLELATDGGLPTTTCSASSGEAAYDQICEIARSNNLIIGAAGGVIVIGHPDEIAKVEAKRNPSTVMDLWGIAPEGDQGND